MTPPTPDVVPLALSYSTCELDLKWVRRLDGRAKQEIMSRRGLFASKCVFSTLVITGIIGVVGVSYMEPLKINSCPSGSREGLEGHEGHVQGSRISVSSVCVKFSPHEGPSLSIDGMRLKVSCISEMLRCLTPEWASKHCIKCWEEYSRSRGTCYHMQLMQLIGSARCPDLD